MQKVQVDLSEISTTGFVEHSEVGIPGVIFTRMYNSKVQSSCLIFR